jgi:hypothetical protein
MRAVTLMFGGCASSLPIMIKALSQIFETEMPDAQALIPRGVFHIEWPLISEYSLGNIEAFFDMMGIDIVICKYTRLRPRL